MTRFSYSAPIHYLYIIVHTCLYLEVRTLDGALKVGGGHGNAISTSTSQSLDGTGSGVSVTGSACAISGDSQCDVGFVSSNSSPLHCQ